MRVMPVTMTACSSKLKTSNNQKISRTVTNPVVDSQPTFKGGKAIVGGYVLGVLGTLALSTVAPVAILGAGVVAIGGAVAGDAIGNSSK